MIFPIAVTRKKPLNGFVEEKDMASILEYIKDIIQRKSAKNIIIENSTVKYKGSTSYSRASLFGNLKGVFSIVIIEDKSWLVYEFRMTELFIFSSIAAIVFGVIFQNWWFGAVAFLWLGGMNWIVYNVRHDILVSDIADGINLNFLNTRGNTNE